MIKRLLAILELFSKVCDNKILKLCHIKVEYYGMEGVEDNRISP